MARAPARRAAGPADRPHLLIVNDDGIASPMLAAMARALAPLARVSVVVPAEEQSWQGKAMTRYGRVYATPSEGLGVPTWVVTGTPSDCVNLAVHHLLPAPPDWVLSGINIGSNAGAAYVIHSGTIAAALEGMLQGLPAVAFSTYLQPEVFREWSAERRLSHPVALAVIESTTARMAAMMATLLGHGQPAADAVLSINFPGPVTDDTPVRWVPLHRNRYGALFRPDGDAYVHAGQLQLRSADRRLTDRAVILRGEISATLISLTGLGAPPPPRARRPF